MDAKENRILEVATTLFAKHGLRKTTVEEISTAADVGKGTIYLFFETKEQLFAAVVVREGKELLRKIRTAVRKEVGAVAKLRALMLTRFRSMDDLVNLHQVSSDVFAELRPSVASAREDYVQAERALIESILEEGVENQEMQSDDLPLVTLTIGATMEALESPWLFEGRELRMERKVDALLRLFVEGLKYDARSVREGRGGDESDRNSD